MKSKSILSVAIVFMLVVGITLSCAADTFPSEEVTIIVPYGTGGGNDMLARALEPYLEDELGVPVVIENIPGAAAIIGTTAAYRVPADGYTIGSVSMPAHNVRAIVEDTIYESSDFTTIGRVSAEPYTVVVHEDIPYDNIVDLMNAVQDNPGEYSIGGLGPLGAGGIAVAWITNEMNVDWRYIPYDDTSSLFSALLGKHLDIAIMPGLRYWDFHEDGDIKILALTWDEEIDEMPGIPTFGDEIGVNVVSGSHRGHVINRDVSEEKIQVLREAYKNAATNPEFVEHISKQMPYGFMDGEEFDELYLELDRQLEDIIPVLDELVD